MVRKTVAARTRSVEKVEVGEMVFFYRNYPQKKAQQLQSQRGCYLGPGIVIGLQGKNVWISYAGRCYLVAPEHVRGLAPDECALTKPLIREGLEQLKQASKSRDYIDISGQDATNADVQEALERPAGDDNSADPGAVGSTEVPAEPVVTLEPANEEMDKPGEVTEMEQTVGDHIDETAESSAEKRKAASATEDERTPVGWTPEGSNDTLRWKKENF